MSGDQPAVPMVIPQDVIDSRLRALYGETLGRMDERLKNIENDIKEIKTDSGKEDEDTKKAITDHERRIQLLEQRVVAICVASALGGWIIGNIIPHLSISVIPH